MPGFNQAQLNPKVQNGNAVSILLGDQVVGFGQSTSAALDYGAETLHGIGSAKPQEIQQLKMSPSITLDTFQLTPEGLKFFGMATTLGQVLANNQFNFYIVDNNGVPLVTYVGCVAGSHSLNFPANAICTEAVSFQAMDVLDANGASILQGNNANQFNPLAASAGTSVNLQTI